MDSVARNSRHSPAAQPEQSGSHNQSAAHTRRRLTLRGQHHRIDVPVVEVQPARVGRIEEGIKGRVDGHTSRQAAHTSKHQQDQKIDHTRVCEH